MAAESVSGETAFLYRLRLAGHCALNGSGRPGAAGENST